ncbi:organic cation/carnitine transporter 7 isoform X3 [Setaria viridis]|uniref:organic cation/carnitine transporter 7 isoform X3 n=1 Tax=Setaria viridis TaxID=4556 RepID=UPI003B3B5403
MASEGEAATHYTTDDALTRVGFGRFQALLLAYSGVGWVAEAFEIMLLSFVGPAVEAEWGVSGAEQGLISSVVFAGMLIGSIAGGLIADRCGRRLSCQDLDGGGCLHCPRHHALSFSFSFLQHLNRQEDNAGTEDDTSSKTSGIVAFQALWSYDLLQSTFLLWFLYLANYFAYYGVILLTSELSNGKRRCTSARTHLMQPNSINLYRDVLLTSLAGGAGGRPTRGGGSSGGRHGQAGERRPAQASFLACFWRLY